MKKSAVFFFLFFISSTSLWAQKADSSIFFIHIRSIIINGNKVTRQRVILRALTFAPGDSMPISGLTGQLDVSKNNLINTGLFYEVNIEIKNWVKKDLDISIALVERGYTTPLPTFDLYDRNLNNWWVVNHHDLNRIQYGIYFLHKNTRGRNEDLQVDLLLGYAQKLNVSYYIPFFDRRQKEGLRLRGFYGRNKILSYSTFDNKQSYFQSDDVFARHNWGVEADWIVLPAFHYKHVFSLTYNKATITDSISHLNTDYFLNGRKIEEFLTFNYTLSRDYLDIRAYPLKGSFFEASLSKIGLPAITGLPSINNVDMTTLYLTYNKYVPLGGPFYFSWENRAKFSLPKIQPYYNQRALGYRLDYVSGYEYYVIDGQQFGLTKINLKYRMFRARLVNPWIKGPVHVAKFPFTMYLRAQVNSAYVQDSYYNKQNPLNNTILIGGGPALDIVLFYDVTASVEYSWNRMGESGLFFHLNLTAY